MNITKDNYLKALDIVIEYHAQLKKEIEIYNSNPKRKELGEASSRLKNVIRELTSERSNNRFVNGEWIYNTLPPKFNSVYEIGVNDIRRARNAGKKTALEFKEIMGL